MISLTPRIVAYLGSEEGIVCEAYLDSDTPPNWTFGMGETARSGVNVKQYKDNPQPLSVALKLSIDMINREYLPPVLHAFGSYTLAENELAAALSFEWNTGAIELTSWVNLVKTGDRVGAQSFLRNHYLDGTVLKARRNREADLFFKGIWPSPMETNVQTVAKPSYKPVGDHPTNILPIVQQILGGG